MAIQKIKINNFKCFKGLFEIELNKGLNILVGNNETGKSTILEAMHIALTGLYGGRNIRNELSQYLFNKEVVDSYINSVNNGTALPPPFISNVISNEYLYPLIYITVIFGLRREEVLGLKWDSVNFENETVTIKHTVVCYDKMVFQKDSTKNDSSLRSFPLLPEVKEILLSLKAQEQENKKLFGKSYNNNDYIFKWQDGTPFNPNYITRKWSKLLSQYNLRHIRFHDLRHSCASLLVSFGFTIKDIQEWLGHSDIQTTANIYAHLSAERKNNIANTITSNLKF